jgi:hypothetical protein
MVNIKFMERIKFTKQMLILKSNSDNANSFVVEKINKDIAKMTDCEYENVDLMKMQFFYNHLYLRKSESD